MDFPPPLGGIQNPRLANLGNLFSIKVFPCLPLKSNFLKTFLGGFVSIPMIKEFSEQLDFLPREGISS